ncbi:MAG: hypothetical protein HYY03_03655, partial [Chloroflexi bacterium]|nr:hypothetical protein [Chloroflexota bacterium]
MWERFRDRWRDSRKRQPGAHERGPQLSRRALPSFHGRWILSAAIAALLVATASLVWLGGAVHQTPSAAASSGTDGSVGPSAYAAAKTTRHLQFTFVDGSHIDETWTGGNEATVTTSAGLTMTIHVSCSDRFFGPDKTQGTADDGYGEKGDPTQSKGHPRIATVDGHLNYKISIFEKGQLKKVCGAFATATPTATPTP